MSTNILASRKKHSRNIISKFIVEGFDAEEIHQLDRQVDAAAVITLWVGRQLREAKAKAMEKNQSILQEVARTAMLRKPST